MLVIIIDPFSKPHPDGEAEQRTRRAAETGRGHGGLLKKQDTLLTWRPYG